MSQSSKPTLDEMLAAVQTAAALPEAEARCLPGMVYTNPDFFDYEVETFLGKEWHCLGRADEIPKPGNFFTAQLLNEPLIVVRGDEGEIVVLSNVCRHRGMKVAEGKGSKKTFVCPYHAWQYDRAGVLVHAPHMEARTAELENCSLPSFASEVWNGFIYVNLAENPEPLAPRLKKLDELLANYEPEDMRVVGSFEEEWRTNWKCLIENFSESYHLSVVHPRTLRPYTPTEMSRKSLSDDSFTAYVANYPEKTKNRGMGSPKLSAEERYRSTLFCVFPGHLASQAASLLASFSVQPIAVDRINVRWTLSAYKDELNDEEVEQRIALWHDVNREDREKLEKMQVSLGSRHAPTGPLNVPHFEGTIWDFYRYLGRQLG